ncbi:MAG: hypothetical protein GY861_29040 [bacterium]|nr:hypothetical protein [bacterium]
MVLEKLGELLKRGTSVKHVAVTLDAAEKDMDYARKRKMTLDELYLSREKIIFGLLKAQVQLGIPVITVKIVSSSEKDPEQFPVIVDAVNNLFGKLKDNEFVHKNRIKISALGKWYDFDRAVDSIKAVLDATSDHDQFYFNVCINYNGQEEIVNACKILSRKVAAEKLDADKITKESIKENLYSSYLIPPQVIIKNDEKTLSSILLWDAVYAHIYFTGREWPDFKKSDFVKALSSFT